MQVIQFLSEVEVAIKSLAQDLSAIFPNHGMWFLICISYHLIPWLGFELVSRELHLLKGPFEDAVIWQKVLFSTNSAFNPNHSTMIFLKPKFPPDWKKPVLMDFKFWYFWLPREAVNGGLGGNGCQSREATFHQTSSRNDYIWYDYAGNDHILNDYT